MQTQQLQRQMHAGPGVLRPRHLAACASPVPLVHPAACQQQRARRTRAAAPLRCQAAAPAVAAAPRPEGKFEPQVCVVLGTQWGDEGKGKLVDILAQEYEIVARAQVSGATGRRHRPGRCLPAGTRRQPAFPLHKQWWSMPLAAVWKQQGVWTLFRPTGRLPTHLPTCPRSCQPCALLPPGRRKRWPYHL